MGVDPLPVADELGQLLAHRLVHLDSRLHRVRVRHADEQVGQAQVPLDERERAVAVERCADECRRSGVAVEEHVLPRDLDVVEHDHRVDLVEVRGHRIVDRIALRERRPAYVPDAGRAHLDHEPDRVVGELGVAPVADCRFDERLVGVRRCRLELGPAHDDPAVGLAGDVQQHIGILVLGAARAIALRVGVGRHMERVAQLGVPDVGADVLGEGGIDVVQDVLPVVERPHLADRLVTHAGDDAAEIVEHAVDRRPLVAPVLLGQGPLGADRAALSGLIIDVRHHGARGLLVRQVVDAGASVDDWLEGGMRRHVLHLLAVDPNCTSVAERLAVLLTGPDHLL